jgi:hypothetical protein
MNQSRDRPREKEKMKQFFSCLKQTIKEKKRTEPKKGYFFCLRVKFLQAGAQMPVSVYTCIAIHNRYKFFRHIPFCLIFVSVH